MPPRLAVNNVAARGEWGPLAVAAIKRLRWSGLGVSARTLTALDRFWCLASKT
jgi:hypothetical protein